MSSGFEHLKNPLIDLSPEEQLFRDSISDFASKKVSPIWVENDEASFNKPVVRPELMRELGAQGLLAMTCSEKNGGQGASQTMATIATEELAYADPSVAIPVYVLLNTGWPYILERHGLESVASSVIPMVSRGEAFFGIASTESQGGSDLGNLMTSAKAGPLGYSVSGTKSFISGVNEVFNLPWGGGWLLMARTGGPGHKGLTAFVALPRTGGNDSPGVTHSLFNGLGRHGLSTGYVTFDAFEIPKDHVVGGEGKGFYVAMEGFNCARILVAAACVGASRWLLEKGAEWIKQREVFGKRLSSYQGVNFRFAELYGRYEASRMLVYRAARLYDRIHLERRPGYKESDLNAPVAMAKMWGPEVSLEIAQEVLKWMGASAFVRSNPVHRSFLGLMSYIIGAEGAQNVMKYITARELLGQDFTR